MSNKSQQCEALTLCRMHKFSLYKLTFCSRLLTSMRPVLWSQVEHKAMARPAFRYWCSPWRPRFRPFNNFVSSAGATLTGTCNQHDFLNSAINQLIDYCKFTMPPFSIVTSYATTTSRCHIDWKRACFYAKAKGIYSVRPDGMVLFLLNSMPIWRKVFMLNLIVRIVTGHCQQSSWLWNSWAWLFDFDSKPAHRGPKNLSVKYVSNQFFMQKLAIWRSISNSIQHNNSPVHFH